ncbi:MAG: hypothetical protein WCN87_03960 [Chlamydiota bacterium]
MEVSITSHSEAIVGELRPVEKQGLGTLESVLKLKDLGSLNGLALGLIIGLLCNLGSPAILIEDCTGDLGSGTGVEDSMGDLGSGTEERFSKKNFDAQSSRGGGELRLAKLE